MPLNATVVVPIPSRENEIFNILSPSPLTYSGSKMLRLAPLLKMQCVEHSKRSGKQRVLKLGFLLPILVYARYIVKEKRG